MFVTKEIIEKMKNVSLSHYVNETNLIHARDFLKARNEAFINYVIKNSTYPYCNNEIVANNRFTNLKRELDSVTMNLLSMYRNHIDDKDKTNLLLNIIFWRTFRISKHPFFIPFTSKNEEVIKTYDKRILEHDKIIGKSVGAYMISGANKSLEAHFRKTNSYVTFFQSQAKDYCNLYFNKLVNGFKNDTYKEKTYAVTGIKNFSLYQNFLDLSYLPFYPLSENDFVLSGIGCSTGLSYFFHREHISLSDEELLIWVYLNSEYIFKVKWDKFFVKPKNLLYYKEGFTLANVENFFCEFHKYMKLLLNLRCKKRKYNG